MSMNICVSANAKYERYLSIMLCSLAETNKENDLQIYILNSDFSTENKRELCIPIDIDNNRIHIVRIEKEHFSNLPTTLEYSIEAYFRLLMPEVLPINIDRVLYLDVDILVMDSLKGLYETDLSGCFVGACLDMGRMTLDPKRKKQFRRKNDDRYFNSGVMLWDLKKIRGTYRFSDYLDAAGKLNYDLPCVDQDILNYMLYDKVKYLDPMKYNILLKELPEDVDISDAKIIHFCGRAPWVFPGQSEPYLKWWEYAKRTPFYLELLEEQNKRIYDRYFKVDFPQEKEMRAVLDLALELKASGKVERYINRRNMPYILYGCGYMAQKLMQIFVEPPGDLFVAAIDETKTGNLNDIPIYSSFSSLNGIDKYAVVVTPTRDTEGIVNVIISETPDGTEVITLKSFLLAVSNYDEEVK